MADIKTLEFSTLKVPYEILNKNFRAAQKSIDKEISHVVAATNDFEKQVSLDEGEDATTADDLAGLLDGVVDKLCVLKRKAEENITTEIDAAKICKRRVAHLKESQNQQKSAQAHWKRMRLDRMLVDYLLRMGYYQSAIQLVQQSGIQDLTNLDIFLISKQVEDSLMNRNTGPCLAWCYDHRSKLRKMKSTLEFNVRLQEFIELLRQDSRVEAIKHARKHFPSCATEPEQLKDVQRAMGMLAFPTTTDIPAYKDLLKEVRWKLLVKQFRRENFSLHQLGDHSPFTVTLQAGLSAIKTKHCYHGVEDKNPECPVCTPQLNQLACSLPYAHCSQSRLVCPISGCIMNENNAPMMLPNGHVYSDNALLQMAAENGGKVICPRTKEIFNINEIEKVFIM